MLPRKTLLRLLSTLFLAGFIAAAAVYPMERSWLAAILVAYLALLAWRPHCWLLLLPALLPVLDLAQRTGWFFLEEIDVLLLATAASCYWHMALSPHAAPRLPRLFQFGLALLVVALACGLWRALQPLPPFDANALTNYLSPYNALRVGKGWIWALVLLPPLRWSSGPMLLGIQRYLVPGTLAGLALVCYAEIRERVLFPGLLNFSADYRASAPFSAMHTGGAALDGFLALTVPLITMWLSAKASLARNTTALLLLACAGYAGLSTFSRGLYLAFAVATAIVLLLHRSAAPWHQRAAHVMLALGMVAALNALFDAAGYRGLVPVLALGTAVMMLALRRHAGRLRYVLPTLSFLVASGLAVPFAHGYYTAERFANSASDFQERMRHWQSVLAIMDSDVGTSLFGMGLGKFPATYFWRNQALEQPASYRYVDEPGNRYLLLNAPSYQAGYGELLRILQRVEVHPERDYVLALDVRTSGPPAFLHLRLCERQLLYPQACITAPVNQVPASARWQRYRFSLRSGLLASRSGIWTRPVQLEIAAEGEHAALAIDNISLYDTFTGHELVRNGSFSDGNDYWFFSSDHYHLPWHIKNLPLNLYFEMGWLGLIAFLLMLLSASGTLLPRALNGDKAAAAWLACLAGFLSVGLFDSLVDVPRITLLFLLLLCAAVLRPGTVT